VAYGGQLAPDTYTVELASRSTGWTDTSGSILDGLAIGTPGSGDYVHQFTISASSEPVVSLPSFARGPGQAVNVSDAVGSYGTAATSTTTTVTGAANNGSGLIRLHVASSGAFAINEQIDVSGVLGTTEANGTWTIAGIPDSTHIDLAGSTFTHAYSSGGVVTLLAQDLPIHLSNTTGVLSLDFDLVYNPSLLTISSAVKAAGLPGNWGVFYNSINLPSGQVELLVSASGTSALSGAAMDVVDLVASVPSSAISTYGAAQLLQLTNVAVNEQEIPVLTDEALEKVAYFGDATGDGTLSGFDSNLISRNVVHLDNGFTAYPLTDPRIVADVTGDGTLSGLDASYVAQKSVSLIVPQIPDVPSHGSLTHATVDPTVTIPLGTVGIPGSAVDVPVGITGLNGLDQQDGLAGASFTFTYDASRLSLTNDEVTTSVPGWFIVGNVTSPGTVLVTMYSGGPTLTSDTSDLLDLNFQVPSNAPAGTAAVSATGSLNEGNLSLSVNNGSVIIPPPEVSSVLVDGTGWVPAFLTSLQTANALNVAGYAIPAGSATQLNALPWVNLNQIRIVFNEDVNVQQSSLALTGINVPSYAFSGFSYNSATHTAVWTLTSPIGDDKLHIDLKSTGPSAVTSAHGDALDGEWHDGTSSFPSGDGTAGGDFNYHFNVLPGDANQSGVVNGLDISLASANWLQVGGIAGDVNGDNVVNGLDIAAISSDILTGLPAGNPSVGGGQSLASGSSTSSSLASPQAAAPPTVVSPASSFAMPQGSDRTAAFVGRLDASKTAAAVDRLMSEGDGHDFGAPLWSTIDRVPARKGSQARQPSSASTIQPAEHVSATALEDQIAKILAGD
jgi:hypothetical protein